MNGIRNDVFYFYNDYQQFFDRSDRFIPIYKILFLKKF